MSEAPPPAPEDPGVGLCARCTHVRIVESNRGARFYRCEYSRVDPRFPKYPALPVRSCRAYAPPAAPVS